MKPSAQQLKPNLTRTVNAPLASLIVRSPPTLPGLNEAIAPVQAVSGGHPENHPMRPFLAVPPLSHPPTFPQCLAFVVDDRQRCRAPP